MKPFGLMARDQGSGRVILSEAKEPSPEAWLLRFAQDDPLAPRRPTTTQSDIPGPRRTIVCRSGAKYSAATAATSSRVTASISASI